MTAPSSWTAAGCDREALIADQVRARAGREGCSAVSAVRQHALEGVLRRLDGAPEDLILRGGLLLRHLCGPVRLAQDVDFLACFPFDLPATAARVQALCERPCADGVRLTPLRSEVIWAETRFPGVRLSLQAALAPPLQQLAGADALPLQLDVGFNDPLHAPPLVITCPGAGPGLAAAVRACPAESMLAWKLHALYERGRGRWRPKDLYDLHLLLRHATLDPAHVPAAVALAFESRGDPLALLDGLRAGQFGTSPWSQRKWMRFEEDQAGLLPVPALPDMVTLVAAALQPLLPAGWP